MRLILLFGIFFIVGRAEAQKDSLWFPGGDDGFYRYLSDRLDALGSARPELQRNGESVAFRFWLTDSGVVDSVQVGLCFNAQLCYQLRLILNTMPQCKPRWVNGKPTASWSHYQLDIVPALDGFVVQPSRMAQPATALPSKLKWGIAVIATVAMLIAVFH
ncbi:MAG: hypothetical protein JNL57_10610 [Bacteroidetes bacterium]|nr:hypothetical protein [Bacteroidota bacterium]